MSLSQGSDQGGDRGRSKNLHLWDYLGWGWWPCLRDQHSKALGLPAALPPWG